MSEDVLMFPFQLSITGPDSPSGSRSGTDCRRPRRCLDFSSEGVFTRTHSHQNRPLWRGGLSAATGELWCEQSACGLNAIRPELVQESRTVEPANHSSAAACRSPLRDERQHAARRTSPSSAFKGAVVNLCLINGPNDCRSDEEMLILLIQFE